MIVHCVSVRNSTIETWRKNASDSFSSTTTMAMVMKTALSALSTSAPSINHSNIRRRCDTRGGGSRAPERVVRSEEVFIV